MRYKTLDQWKAHEVLDRMDPPDEASPSLRGVESTSGTGQMVDDELFIGLAHQLNALRTRTDRDMQRFDAEGCVQIHQAVPHEPELLSDDGFWRWLSLGPLQEIVAWRFPPGRAKAELGDEPQRKFNRQNFGVGASARQRSECYAYKLWLRAELGLAEDGDDRYRFAKRGDVDFWTSHVLRQAYTTNRKLCAALVRFQFPDERNGRPTLLAGTEQVSEGRRGIRTLAKRIRRLQATCELSIMEESELAELMSELAEDLTRAP